MAQCLFIYRNQVAESEPEVKDMVLGREFRKGHSLGSLVGEVTPQSQLFNALASVPLLEENEALEAYKYTLSSKVVEALGEGKVNVEELSPQDNAILSALSTTESNKVVYLTDDGTFTENIQESTFPVRPVIQTEEGEVYFADSFHNTIDENGELKPVFRTNNRTFDRYDKALKKAQGEPIQIGVSIPQIGGNNFIPLYEVTSTTNPITTEGIINYGIVENIVHPTKVATSQGFFYRGKGATVTDQILNANRIAELLNIQKGHTVAEVREDSLVEINDVDPNLIQTIEGDYTVEELRDELVREGGENFKRKFGEDAVELAYLAITQTDPILPNQESDFVPAHETSPREDSELLEILFDVINSLGVKVVSLSDYVENYNKRFGKDPDINALADIGRRILALAEMETIDTDVVTEELAHFILEAYENQESLFELREEVMQTQEWAEHNQEYYRKYSEKYSGEQLDNIVFKEILGKLLANRIKETQAQIEAGRTPRNLVQRLFDVFSEFISKIRNFFSPEIQSNLNNILNEISEKVLDKSILDYVDEANLDKSEFMMYSLEDRRALVALMKSVDALERQLISLTKSRDPQAQSVRTTVSRIKEATDESIRKSLTEDIIRTNEWIAIRSVVASISSLVAPLKVKFQSNQKHKVTQQDLQILQEANNYNEVLSELKEAVRKSKYANPKQREQLIKTIDFLNTEISDLTPQINNLTAEMLEDHIDKYLEITNFNETEKDAYRDQFYKTQSDVNWFSRYYGFLQHQNNVFLNSLSWVINRMHFNANKEYVNVITPFLQKVEKMGFNKGKFENLIQKTKDGKFSRFFKSAYNLASFYNDLEIAQLTAYNEAMETSYNLKEYKEGLKKGTIKKPHELSLDKQMVYENYMDNWYLENTERRHTAEFYREQAELWQETYIWDDNDIKEGDISIERGSSVSLHMDTKNLLDSISARRGWILSKYRGEDGRVDYVKLSESVEDSTMLDLLKIERDNLKSLYDTSTRERKTGLELKIAQDIHYIDGRYQERLKGKRDISEDFWKKAKDIAQEAQRTIPDNDPQKARKVNTAVMTFFRTNGGFTFSEQYWNERKDSGEAYVQRLDAMINVTGNTQLRAVVEELRELLDVRRELTKKYRDRNDLTDTLVENITVVDMESFIEVESRIQELTQQVQSVAESVDIVMPEIEIESETTLNNAYTRALENSNQDEYYFLKEHMTPRDVSSMERFKVAIDEFKISGRLPKFVERFFIREYGLKDSAAVGEFLGMTDIEPEALAVAYGRRKVFTYFKKSAPVGYSRLMAGLDSGVINIHDFIDEMEYSHKGLRAEDGTVLDHLEMKPNYQWFEETIDDKLNPNFDPNFKGGRLQPRVDKYLDDSFFAEFGIDKNQFIANGELNATRNKEEFGLLQDIYELMEYSIDKYGDTGVANIYQLPQFSKGSLERAEDTVSGKGVTAMVNTVKDLVKNRVDDLGYGERVGDTDIRDFSDVRVIPKYGMRLLEEHTDISHEIAYSLGRMVQLATLYKHKLDVVNEVTMLEQQVQEKTKGKKSGAETRAAEMAKDFIDYYIYGIGRTQKIEWKIGNQVIDITKMAMNFERYVRKVNLGFNPAIAATAYSTSEVWLNIERGIQEYMGSSSLAWADKTLPQLIPDYFANMGKISNNSKIKLLQERFLVADIADRTKSSGYNRVLRMTGDMSFKMLEATDIPILNRLMLGLMKDHRVVGNRLLNYKEFQKQALQDGKTKSEIKAEWKAVENQSAYELVEIKDGKIVPTLEARAMFEGMPEDYIERKLDQIGMKLHSVHSFVDGRMSNLDRVAATRNLMIFTIAHRSWALISLARMFKTEHFNPLTGQWEKGHVRSFGTYFKNLFGSINAKTHENLIEAIKSEWHTLDDLDKTNIQRLLLHTGVLASLMLIGLAVVKAVDDDDNKDEWALQYASYIYFRTINELSSQHFPLGLTETVQMAKTPFMALQNIEEFINAKNYSLDTVQSGAYKGHSRLYRHVAKQTFLRHYYDTTNITQKSRFYRMNNAANLLWLGK